MSNIRKKSYFKLPKSALAIYTKLYCKKRGINNKEPNILMEATKSWITLSKTEKQYFFNLFEEYKAKIQNVIGTSLQNVHPYMKKKQIREKDTTRLTTENTDFSTRQDDNTNNDPCQPCIMDQEIDCHQTLTQSHDTEMNKKMHEQFEDSNTTNIPQTPELDAPRFISEPAPPLRSSMELFEILKNNEESAQHLNWNDLSKTQKQRYQRAVLTIKLEYINQYKAYLEQLTPKQLFEHYKAKILV